MKIRLYKTDKDNRVVDKSPTLIKEVNAYTVGDIDMLSPVLILDNLSDASFKNCNYCYIEEFNRYYYCKLKRLPSKKIEVSCSIDVLYSNKDYILNATATISTNENKKNGYLIDEQYKALCYNQITAKKFPSGMASNSIILMTVG